MGKGGEAGLYREHALITQKEKEGEEEEDLQKTPAKIIIITVIRSEIRWSIYTNMFTGNSGHVGQEEKKKIHLKAHQSKSVRDSCLST